MAKFKISPTTNVTGYLTAKVKGAIVDADMGKPVKLSVDVPDTYELCADGDVIDAFLVSVATATADGLALCTINNQNYVGVQASGASTIGAFVAAAAPAAIGTAEANGVGVVSTHTPLVTDSAKWRIVSANTSDGTVADGDSDVVIERV